MACLQWKRGERTYYAMAKQVADIDGATSFFPVVQTVIRDAAGPVVEARQERFPNSNAALLRAKGLLQQYFGLDPQA